MGKVNIPETKFAKKIIIALLILVILIVFAILVIKPSMDNAEDAVYRSINLVTHAEIVQGITGMNKYWLALFSILGGVIEFYLVYVILEYLLEGKLKNIFLEAKTMKTINSLKDHYIICGAGRVGANIAEELKKRGKEFVIAEKDLEHANKLKEKNYLVIHGTSADKETLIKAGIKKAKCLFAVTGDDGKNVLIVLTAKEINPKIKIIARANHTDIVDKLKSLGVSNIVLPELLGAKEMIKSVLGY